MKTRLTIILLLVVKIGFTQIPVKEQIQEGYYVGYKAFEALQTLDLEIVNRYFKDTINLSLVIHEIESSRFSEDSIKIIKDVMYNQESRNYEFLVYGGKHIPSGDSWGLYDYYFVILLEIDLRKDGMENRIIKTKIIQGNDTLGLVEWWRTYMMSYEDAKYARKEIADRYSMVPPPPPPPESKNWLNNN